MCWPGRHRFVREGDEPYIKCECGKTIEFQQLSDLPFGNPRDGLLPAEAVGPPVESEMRPSHGWSPTGP
jgi:hypothetical protein